MGTKNNDFLESSWKEAKRKKYTEGNWNAKIQEERYNFLFLTDGSFVYDYLRFNSVDEAIVDAVVNGGEDLDEMISLVYFQTNSCLKPMLLKEIAKLRNNQ